jgi:hypothetical protein
MTPPNCRFPATRQQKAKAHKFASFYCFARRDLERASSHDKKAKELVPEVNWDDPDQEMKFMVSE